MKLLCSLFLLCILFSCSKPVFTESWVKQKAPEKFSARFETSKGNFDADFVREYSPFAVDRLFTQIKHHAYDHTLFYRVRPGYVAQFGISDSASIKNWEKYKVPDEPVIKPNERGAISFARSGKESRDVNLFINLKNNSPRLDTLEASGVKGYPVVGLVNSGMEVVDSLYSGYSDNVFAEFQTMIKNKHAFLQKFPKLDSIKRVYLIRKKK